MQKIIFGIFAHPDDEAFGPVGKLIDEVKSGAKLHLICLTSGDAGQNPDDLPELGPVRLEEWQLSGKLIGASSMQYLGYDDGKLSNTTMIDAARKIERIVRDNTSPDCEIEFITFDLNGLTGHIDHIVASRAASLAYYRLKDSALPMKSISYFCNTDKQMPDITFDWIYSNRGLPESELVHIDTTDHLDTIKQVIGAHRTQREDGLKRLNDPYLGHEYFLIKD